MSAQADPRGSVWRRWDPHIHTPGTALNNQFGTGTWDAYLTRLEESEPRIEVLGVTDYCSIDEYEVVLAHKAAGRLPDVGLIFPNVEFRLPTATGRGRAVNLHLLFSPEDPNHVEEARRFLRTLTFQYQRETFVCDRGDLIRLGRAHDSSVVDDTAALRAGINQFKLNLENLKESLEHSEWAQENVIVAVAGGSGDGTSGVRDRAGSLEAVRAEIERMARVVFASSQSQREFWTGDGDLTLEELGRRYDGVKLCMHGSDAHELAKVGVPDESRFTWIKGDASFGALRQACLAPKERGVVAPLPPDGALPYRVIENLAIEGADWVTTPNLPISRGLVAVIGARGSGKTALADLIAAGAGASSENSSDQTFLQRARAHVGGATVTLTWGDGTETQSVLPPSALDPDALPGVRYLSQQFVERLCSAEGMTDELLMEVERVIFEAHPFEERLGAASFSELLNRKASRGRGVRRAAQEEMGRLAGQIEAERQLIDGLAALRAQQQALVKSLDEDLKARAGLVVSGGPDRARRLEEVNAALSEKQAEVDALHRRNQALSDLSAEATELRDRRLPEIGADLQRRHVGAGLAPEDWEAFKIGFASDPVPLLVERIAALRAEITRLTGAGVSKPDVPIEQLDPFIVDDSDLRTVSLNLLRAESWRLGQLIGLDANRQRQLQALNEKISKAATARDSIAASIESAEGARERITELIQQRKDAYASLFDGYVLEQEQLEAMYAPLKDILDAEAGALGKLTFSVRRVVDVDAWARMGESLLDLRTGVFRGRGELARVARELLQSPWESGSSSEVAEAMSTFRAEHDAHLIEQARVPRSDSRAFRAWGAEVANWLNSTEHITLSYGVQYDGVNIEQLSPGTRGIVLLLLYLAVDRSDDRPLVIDQPEENLDPMSIFVELVGRFTEARRRRQIIIVTHNANLVINSDADQVIVATAGPHRPGRLPEIGYESGGIENPRIRSLVCEILEGGRRAFEERARRLRIGLG